VTQFEPFETTFLFSPSCSTAITTRFLAVAAFPIAARAGDDNPYKNAKVGDTIKHTINTTGPINVGAEGAFR
jgi:hypothetical protein